MALNQTALSVVIIHNKARLSGRLRKSAARPTGQAKMDPVKR